MRIDPSGQRPRRYTVGDYIIPHLFVVASDVENELFSSLGRKATAVACSAI